MTYTARPGFFVRLLVIAAAVAVAAWLLPGIRVVGGAWQVLGLALVLALINMIIRPILIFLSLPAVLISLGLFLLIINAITLSWAASWTGWLEIDGFGWAFLGALIVTIVSTFLQRRFSTTYELGPGRDQ